MFRKKVRKASSHLLPLLADAFLAARVVHSDGGGDGELAVAVMAG